MMIYANRPHSYRDLPMRIGEIAHDFRYESSGTLKGIGAAATSARTMPTCSALRSRSRARSPMSAT